MSTNSKFPVLLNVTKIEGNNHCDIKADITGFRVQDVSVTAWEDCLIVEMQSRQEPGQSYYLGAVEPESYRRVIPLGFQINAHDVRTHYQNGKLSINVTKLAQESSSAASSSNSLA
jgi:HSP20 family molecular chaperone IbpA